MHINCNCNNKNTKIIMQFYKRNKFVFYHLYNTYYKPIKVCGIIVCTKTSNNTTVLAI